MEHGEVDNLEEIEEEMCSTHWLDIALQNSKDRFESQPVWLQERAIEERIARQKLVYERNEVGGGGMTELPPSPKIKNRHKLKNNEIKD